VGWLLALVLPMTIHAKDVPAEWAAWQREIDELVALDRSSAAGRDGEQPSAELHSEIVTRLIDRIKAAEDVRMRASWSYALSAKLRQAYAELDPEVRNTALTALEDEILNDPNEQTGSFFMLVNIPDPSIAQFYEGFLTHEDERIQSYAAKAIEDHARPLASYLTFQKLVREGVPIFGFQPHEIVILPWSLDDLNEEEASFAPANDAIDGDSANQESAGE